jgi:hypothetical protein
MAGLPVTVPVTARGRAHNTTPVEQFTAMTADSVSRVPPVKYATPLGPTALPPRVNE